MCEDLERMPNLFAQLPELLSILLREWTRKNQPFYPLGIAKLVRFAPEQLLRIVQVKLSGGNDGFESGNGFLLRTLFKLFAESGPECALLALEQLKTSCQDQRDDIRREACHAIVHFLQVLPEHEEVHSMCMNAMKDTGAYVRTWFFNELSSVTFEPDSMAANLAWTLTVEATQVDEIRQMAFRSVVRSDQTSAASIEKMIEILLEQISTCTDDDYEDHGRLQYNIDKVLRKCPAKLTVFLPYLASCYNDPFGSVRVPVADIIQDLSSFLPTPQLRELGEMISRIYWEVEDSEVREELVAGLYDIGKKIPDLMDDFRHVFSKDCSNTDSEISKLAEERETVIMIRSSAESVDAINEVFWDQSVRVKKELLRQIERENMINAETAETVLEMVADCMESYNDADGREMFSLLSSAARFRSPSKELFDRWLVRALEYSDTTVRNPVFAQPLDMQLRYYWETADSGLRLYVAILFATGSVTYKAGRDGRSMVSIIRKGKKTELEAPTALVEDVIGLARSISTCASAFSKVPSSSRV